MSTNVSSVLVQILAHQAQLEAHVHRIKQRIRSDPSCSIQAMWDVLATMTGETNSISFENFAQFFKRQSVEYQPVHINLIIQRYGIISGNSSYDIDYDSFTKNVQPISNETCIEPAQSQLNTPNSWLLLLLTAEIRSELEWQRSLSTMHAICDIKNDRLFQVLRNTGDSIFEEDFQAAFCQFGFTVSRTNVMCLFRWFGAISAQAVTFQQWLSRFQFEVKGRDFVPLKNDFKTTASIKTIERIWNKYLHPSRCTITECQKHDSVEGHVAESESLHLSCAFSPTNGETPLTGPILDTELEKRVSTTSEIESNSSTFMQHQTATPSSPELPQSCYEGKANEHNYMPQLRSSNFDQFPDDSPSIANELATDINGSNDLWPSYVCSYCLKYPSHMAHHEIQNSSNPPQNQSPNNVISYCHTDASCRKLHKHTADPPCNPDNVCESEFCSFPIESGSTLSLLSDAKVLLKFIRSHIVFARRNFNLKKRLSERAGFSVNALFQILKNEADCPCLNSVANLFKRYSIDADLGDIRLLIASINGDEDENDRIKLPGLYKLFTDFDEDIAGDLEEKYVAIFLQDLLETVIDSERAKLELITENVIFMSLYDLVADSRGIITCESLLNFVSHFASAEDVNLLISEYGVSRKMQFSDFCSWLIPFRIFRQDVNRDV